MNDKEVDDFVRTRSSKKRDFILSFVNRKLRVQAEEIFKEIKDLSIKKDYGENIPLGFVYMVDVNKIFNKFLRVEK